MPELKNISTSDIIQELANDPKFDRMSLDNIESLVRELCDSGLVDGVTPDSPSDIFENDLFVSALSHAIYNAAFRKPSSKEEEPMNIWDFLKDDDL